MTESLDAIEKELLNFDSEDETESTQNLHEEPVEEIKNGQQNEEINSNSDNKAPDNVKSCRYYFSGFPYDMTEQELECFLKKYGVVDDIYYMVSKDGHFRGMAKATYHFLKNTNDIFEVFKSINFNGIQLRVDYAMTREEREERKEAYNRIRREMAETQEKIRKMTATELEIRRLEYFDDYYNRRPQRRINYDRSYQYDQNQNQRYTTRYEKLGCGPRPERINQFYCKYEPSYDPPERSMRRERPYQPREDDRRRARSRDEYCYDTREYNYNRMPMQYSDFYVPYPYYSSYMY